MWRIIFFLIVALVVVLYGFVVATTEQSVWLVKNFGYWLMWSTCLLLLLAGGRVLQREQSTVRQAVWRALRQPRFWLAAVFIAAVTALLWSLQPSGFKIIMDEPVMASNALRMHEHKEAMVTGRTHLVEGRFLQLDGYVDKRPYFYQFLVSLVHDLTGYRSTNGNWLNLALTLLLLGLVFYFGSIYAPIWGGYLAVSLLATLPLLAMNVSGAGFEILNLVMLLLCCLAAACYLKKPGVARLDLLVLLVILLAQTRYESSLYIVAAGLILLIGWLRERRIILSWISLLAPLLCLPIALQHKIFSAHATLWQLGEGVKAPFGLGFVPDNLRHAGRFFFNWNDSQQPNSLLISTAFVLALLGLAFLAIRGWRRKSRHSQPGFYPATFIFGAVLLFNFALLMAYHWGQLDDIIATRIALPFILLQVLVVIAFIGQLNRGRRLALACLAGIWLFLLAVTVPASLGTNFMARSPGWHKCMWLQHEVRARAGEKVLFVSNFHLMAIVDRAAAIPEMHAFIRKSGLSLHQQLKTYDEILFVHELSRDSADAEFVPVSPLYQDFELEHLSERQITENSMMRTSRLVAVKWREGEADLNLLEQLPSMDEPAAREAFLARHLP